jgi:hypothetical protein
MITYVGDWIDVLGLILLGAKGVSKSLETVMALLPSLDNDLG